MDLIDRDPEGREIEALGAAVDLEGRRVLEIGAGSGRLTWRYAGHGGHVTAIDPDGAAIQQALRDCPPVLRERISFQPVGLERFEPGSGPARFDVVLLSWSL